MREILFLFTLVCANNIHQWNSLALESIRATSTPLPQATRILAILHVAIHDSIVSIFSDAGYKYAIPDAPTLVGSTSEEAAIAASAYHVLNHFFPATLALDAFFSSSVNGLEPILETTNGLYVGFRVAAAILSDREKDGTLANQTFPGSIEAGKWRPTPPNYLPALVPQWASSKPWCMSNNSQFRPLFNTSLSLVNVSDREKIIATYWEIYLLQTWFTLAQVNTNEASLDETARLYCLLSLGLADSVIVAWDAKYFHNIWRPITEQPQLEPLLNTPNYPSYPSLYAILSSTASFVLAKNFPLVKNITLDADSHQTFDSFYDVAREAGLSRVYGGVQFEEAVSAGLILGKLVAMQTANCLKQAPLSPYEIYVENNVPYIIIGIFVLLIIVAAIIFCCIKCYKRRRAKREQGTYINLVSPMQQ